MLKCALVFIFLIKFDSVFLDFNLNSTIMKLSNEIKNGLLIFLGIAALFFILKLIGLEKMNYLRTLNIFIVYYGMRRSLQTNSNEGIFDFGDNIFSIIKTALVGIMMSIIGLYVFIYANGGQVFLNNLSKGFLFGKEPTVSEYCFGLFFEGIASMVILTFICMQSWKAKPSVKI